jgi:ribonuclease Z
MWSDPMAVVRTTLFRALLIAGAIAAASACDAGEPALPTPHASPGSVAEEREGTAGRPAAARPAPGTRVVLLGTGTPDFDPDRSGPATAVISGGRAYVVDLGPGVVRRAAAAHRAGLAALDPARIHHAFVTHLHSDHTAGYADLIVTPALRRSVPLEVYGPPGIEQMTRHLLAAFDRDRAIRSKAPYARGLPGYRVTAHEIAPGPIFEDENVRVTAFPVPHGEWQSAFGYRFDAADRSIVISGDTTAARSIVEACDRCDVLVHEVYRPPDPGHAPQPLRDYHAAYHTSVAQLAKIAAEARPGLLVLTHQLLFRASEATLMEELRAGYDGPVAFGNDLDVY